MCVLELPSRKEPTLADIATPTHSLLFAVLSRSETEILKVAESIIKQAELEICTTPSNYTVEICQRMRGMEFWV